MVELSNKKPKKLCPRCGLEGSGPYERWVKNSRHKRYEPYLYFAHRNKGKLSWCYLGKAEKKTGLEDTKVSSQPSESTAKTSSWRVLDW